MKDSKMTSRQTAIQKGDKRYVTFCKICGTDTEHRVSKYDCCLCAAKRKLQWYHDNKGSIKTYNSQYAQNHKEELKKYRQDNSKHIKKRIKEWKSRPENKKKMNEQTKKRYRENPVERLKSILSTTVWQFCKGRGSVKRGRTHELLGYTAKECNEHIESLFQEGMTWDNQGKNGGWEIDHVKPQSHFTSIGQLKECFALSNLKPEWGEWNRSKGNRFIGSSEDYPMVKKAS